jgi:hypothetical protein
MFVYVEEPTTRPTQMLLECELELHQRRTLCNLGCLVAFEIFLCQ